MRPMMAVIRMVVAVTGAIPVSRGISSIRMSSAVTCVGVVRAATHREVGNKRRNSQDSPQPRPCTSSLTVNFNAQS